MTDELIVADRLTKRYGSIVALSEVDLGVKRGEFLALLGPSGCGKTTLLRTIAGFVQPSDGDITIEGRSVSDMAPDQRPVNTVFQHYALFPHMSVQENIAFGPKRKGGARREIQQSVGEALEMVGMESYGDRYPRELSGGQQQRIALARAIVNKPKALLLDEPLSALDLKLRKHMRLELKRLHEQLGITFIYVTHDQEEVLIMADRIAVMREGKIDQLGTARQIYHEPSSSYVADFIGEANLIRCDIATNGYLHLEHTSDTPLPYAVTEPSRKAVKLMVRPEDIDVGEPESGMDTVSVSGRVLDVIFLGSSTKIVFDLGENQEVTAQPRSLDRMQDIQQGQAMTLHWRRDSARVLDD